MRNDVESFLTIMDSTLSYDMIKHIVQLISTEKNLQIIKIKKRLNVQLNKDIIKLFNTYYYDNNFILYKNEYNQFVLENMGIKNKQIYIYSNRHIQDIENTQEESEMVLANQSSSDHTNEIVLFDQSQNQILYDANGLPIQRRIRLDIVYLL
jgi:hypothetical protein